MTATGEMSETPILIQKDGRGVATVTINRPKVRNAINDQVIRQLTDALFTLGTDIETRIVVLTGNGAAFSAGADLNWMRRMAACGEAENFASAKTISRMMRTLNELTKPTIARVNGPAYAAGVGLVAACDIVIAAEEAVFSISEVRIGLVPSPVSPYILAAIGAKAARRFFLSGEPMSAAEACRLGLVHKIVSGSDLDQAINETISALLAGGPQSQTRAKRLIAELNGRRVDDAVEDLTARCIAEARASPEGREGIQAFLEKRKPVWFR